MSHIKSSRALAVSAFAAVSLFAGVGVWFGYKPGVVAVVVTPRQYVPVNPGGTQTFFAIAHWHDGTTTNISTTGASWQCDPSIGTMTTNVLSTTNAQSVFGWVQATYTGLATRVYVKATSSGSWNPDDDTDEDGFSDRIEIASNTSPAYITLENVKCKLTSR